MRSKKKEFFRINVGLVLAELICIPAFLFEVKRALGGNTLSWAYVFEWPLLALYAVYMWRKLRRDVVAESAAAEAEASGAAPAAPTVAEPIDPDLVAWNEYLARLHQGDTAPEAAPQVAEPENRAD